jgi:hypothetical protein
MDRGKEASGKDESSLLSLSPSLFQWKKEWKRENDIHTHASIVVSYLYKMNANKSLSFFHTS